MGAVSDDGKTRRMVEKSDHLLPADHSCAIFGKIKEHERALTIWRDKAAQLDQGKNLERTVELHHQAGLTSPVRQACRDQEEDKQWDILKSGMKIQDVEDENDDQDEDDDKIMGEMEFSDDEDEGDPEPVSDLVNDKDDRKLRGGQDESIHEENGQGDQSVTGAIGVPSVEPAGETLGITNSNDFLTEKLDLKESTPLDLRCLEVERLVDELLNVNVPRTMKIALDSGAGDHVAGPDQVGHKSIRASRGSQRDAHFIAANGERIRNQGESQLHMLEPGGKTIKSVFQVADVTRALYSVSKICDDGCEVYFTATEAVVTKNGKVVTRFAREGGLYCVEMQIKDEPGNGEAAPFAGQGVKR